MATRSSTSSSSDSETEVTSSRARQISETSRDTTHTGSRLRGSSPTNTIDGQSLADTATVRSSSPTAVSRTTYDSTSATTTNAGGIPIIRPPVLQQQSGTGIGHFGPQVPTGYPTQPPTASAGHQQQIKIDVASAQQQYQQRATQQEISAYSGSTSSSTSGSLSSPGTASIQQRQQQQQQQPQFDATRAMFNQVDTNRTGSVGRDEFRQWAQGGLTQGGGQQQQQQQQQQNIFANQIPAHQVYNELLGPDAFKDVILDIDYGALGGFNAAFQSGGDFSGGQLPPGITIRPAYTNVDSLNYQQHMFNTARTINAGSESNAYDYGGASSGYNYEGANNAYNVTGGQQFDVAKAMFNQVDVNHDGSISRDEFQNWAQGAQANYGGQSYATTTTAANYQTSSAGYGGDVSSNFAQASILDNADPAIASILQQSGLGQVVPR